MFIRIAFCIIAFNVLIIANGQNINGYRNAIFQDPASLMQAIAHYDSIIPANSQGDEEDGNLRNYQLWKSFWLRRLLVPQPQSDANAKIAGTNSIYPYSALLSKLGSQSSTSTPVPSGSFASGNPIGPLGDWTCLGPGVTGTPVPEGTGGIITSVYSPDGGQTIYAGANCGGLWYTKNGGNSWINLLDSYGITGLGIQDIKPDIGSDSVFIATGITVPQTLNSYGVGLLKGGFDASGNFNVKQTGLAFAPNEGNVVSKVLVIPSSKLKNGALKNYIYCIVNGANTTQVYLSTDDGLTFNSLLNSSIFEFYEPPTVKNFLKNVSPPQISANNIAPYGGLARYFSDINFLPGPNSSSEPILFLSTVDYDNYACQVTCSNNTSDLAPMGNGGALVFESKDLGTNWVTLNSTGGPLTNLGANSNELSGPIVYSSFISIGTTPKDTDLVFFMFDGVQDSIMAKLLSDGSICYSSLISNLDPFLCVTKYSISRDKWTYLGKLANDGLGVTKHLFLPSISDTNVFFIGGVSPSKFIFDPSSGKLSSVDYVGLHSDFRCGQVCANSSNEIILAGTDGGLINLSFTNAQSMSPIYTYLSSYLPVNEFYSLAGLNSNPSIIVAGAQDNGKCFFGDQMYMPVSNDDAGTCAIDQNNGDLITIEVGDGGNLHFMEYLSGTKNYSIIEDLYNTLTVSSSQNVGSGSANNGSGGSSTGGGTTGSGTDQNSGWGNGTGTGPGTGNTFLNKFANISPTTIPNSLPINTPLAFNNSNLFIGANDLYVTNESTSNFPNSGYNLSSLIKNLTTSKFPSQNISCFAISTSGDTIYGAFPGLTWNLNPQNSVSLLFKAIGVTKTQTYWTDVTGGLNFKGTNYANDGKNYDSVFIQAYLPITSMTLNPHNANELWITFGNFVSPNSSNQSPLRVIHSIDGGVSFSDISMNLPEFPVNKIIYENGSNGALYVATDVGVYYTNNDMLSSNLGWVSCGKNFAPSIVSDLDINYGDHTIRASTLGRGIWKSNLVCPTNTNLVLTTQVLSPINYTVDIALNSITSSVGLAANNQSTVYEAGSSIILSAGFEVSAIGTGSNFSAYLSNCSQNNNSTPLPITNGGSKSFAGPSNAKTVTLEPLPKSDSVKSILNSFNQATAQIFPNPSKGLITVVLSDSLVTLGPVLFKIFDGLGNSVISQKIYGSVSNFDLHDFGLTNGVFFYQISNLNGIHKYGKLVLLN